MINGEKRSIMILLILLLSDFAYSKTDVKPEIKIGTFTKREIKLEPYVDDMQKREIITSEEGECLKSYLTQLLGEDWFNADKIDSNLTRINDAVINIVIYGHKVDNTIKMKVCDVSLLKNLLDS